MTDVERWHRKATALAQAYNERYHAALPASGIALGLCPAQLETRCGDAWPGPDGLLDTDDDERNWGACTLRGLNGAEKSVLDAAGIKPSIGPGHVDIAKRAMAALADAGVPVASGVVAGDIQVPRATLHCDSHTEKDPASGKKLTIPHFAWFANFDSDSEGAKYYLHMLGAAGRAVLAQANATPTALATAMYAHYYFGGFHPRGKYVDAQGKEHDGNAENIAAYAGQIQYWLPPIKDALRDWSYANGALEPPPEPQIDLDDTAGLWRALQVLGCVRPYPPSPAFTRERLLASLGGYQLGSTDVDGNLLDVDGNAGTKTKAAMRRDLTKLGVPVR